MICAPHLRSVLGPLASPNYGYVRNSHRPAGRILRSAPGAGHARPCDYVAERPPEEHGAEPARRASTSPAGARRARLGPGLRDGSAMPAAAGDDLVPIASECTPEPASWRQILRAFAPRDLGPLSLSRPTPSFIYRRMLAMCLGRHAIGSGPARTSRGQLPCDHEAGLRPDRLQVPARRMQPAAARRR